MYFLLVLYSEHLLFLLYNLLTGRVESNVYDKRFIFLDVFETVIYPYNKYI